MNFVEDIKLIPAESVDWQLCHHCGGGLEAGEITVEDTVAYQNVHCVECEREWTEIYEAKWREERAGVSIRL